MNILSAEEMHTAEIELLAVVPLQAFILKTPDKAEALNINSFTGTIFPSASISTQKQVQKMLSLTQNMRTIKKNDPNSIFQMLAYNLLCILFQDKYRQNDSSEGQNVNYLLETFKCSLYSADVDFLSIKNADFNVDNMQMKGLCARFLNFMEHQALRLTVNRMKWAQWICQHNPYLMRSFVLLFRFILSKLEIQGAKNYKCAGNLEETFINLIEYFDLNYRNFGELFLFYEEGIFMVLTEKEIVAGDYFENQNEKKTQKQQQEIKSSVKLNMIESFLVNVNEKNSLIAPKKLGIVESDMELMSCMLESGQVANEKMTRQKEHNMDTPTFKENPDQFHFGRKRKQSAKQHQFRSEFEKLMDKSDNSEEFIEDDGDSAPTPFLGGNQSYDLSSRFEPNKKPLETISAVDSPIDELSHIQNFSMDFPHVAPTTTNDNLLIIKKDPVKTVQPFDKNPHIDLGFSLGTNDHQFFNSQKLTNAKSSSHQTWKQIISCHCRGVRKERNTINSNVVTVGFLPEYSSRSSENPMQMAMSSSQRRGNIHTPFVSTYEKVKQRLASPTKEMQKQPKDHKPAFLKNLKKNKETHPEHDFSKSTVTDNRERQVKFIERKNSQNFFTKTSGIASQTQNIERRLGGKNEAAKDNDNKSSKSVNINYQTSNNRFDQFQSQRSGLGQPSPQNAMLSSRQGHEQLNNNGQNPQANKGYLSTHNSPKDNQQPYKFYAPVQIIAPTVYFGSSNQNSNNFVFKVNQYNEGNRPSNPEMNRSHQQQLRAKNEAPVPLEQTKNNISTHSSSNLVGYKRERQF